MKVRIVKTNPSILKKLKNPTIILGFPGVGLVGSISASYFVDKLGLELCGVVVSNEFAPLAAIHNYSPLPPVRIYASVEKNILVILSEIVIPIGVSNELAERIIEFSKEIKASKIISLGGISLKEKENSVYAIGNNMEEIEKLAARRIAQKIKEGATTGVTGTLLALSNIHNYSILALLAEADPDFVDPKAASNVLKALSKIIGVNVNTTELEREALLFSKATKDSATKSKTISKLGEHVGRMYG